MSPYTGGDLDLSTPEGAYYGGVKTLRAKQVSAVKSVRVREAKPGGLARPRARTGRPVRRRRDQGRTAREVRDRHGPRCLGIPLRIGDGARGSTVPHRHHVTHI